MESLGDIVRRQKPDDLYHRKGENDRDDILALIGHIRTALANNKTIPKAGREYLADALAKILRDVPAEQAMLLSRSAGRPASTARNAQVFDGIERLRKRGTLQAAIVKVAARKKMTPAAAKRIYYRVKNK